MEYKLNNKIGKVLSLLLCICILFETLISGIKFDIVQIIAKDDVAAQAADAIEVEANVEIARFNFDNRNNPFENKAENSDVVAEIVNAPGGDANNVIRRSGGDG